MANEDRMLVASRTQLQHLGDPVSYVGNNPKVGINAVIDQDVTDYGGEVPIGNISWTCTMMAEDVLGIRRGDEIVEEDGTIWILQERLPESDKWIEQWSVLKK